MAKTTQMQESEGGEMTEYYIKINDGYEKIGEVKTIDFTATVDNLRTDNGDLATYNKRTKSKVAR